jgi:hypothetical protein
MSFSFQMDEGPRALAVVRRSRDLGSLIPNQAHFEQISDRDDWELKLLGILEL